MAIRKRWEVLDEDPFGREKVERHNSFEQLRWVAQLLDSQFRILGIRVGWDAILGLIPGFGDIATNIASFYILIQASNLGAPPSVILRMGLNLVIDNLMDTIPFFGNFIDIFWRANIRNISLLERYLQNPRSTTIRSRWVVALTLVAVALISVACAALAVYVAIALVQWAAGNFGPTA